MRILKRLFDIIFALLFIICFSPFYITTSIIIYISSPGNPIYKAQRVGKDGKIFTLYKFRSMCVNSGKVRMTTLSNDDRVFPFGKFIRMSKIDETPQMFNILFGDMSAVGPRPEDKENADKIYQGKYTDILKVKPGLTSPASLYDYTHGENCENEKEYEESFMPEKLELELYYANNNNFLYDLKLVFYTAWVIIQKVFGKRTFKKPEELKKVSVGEI